MCGIAGGINYGALTPTFIEGQLSSLRHRGPDGEGVYVKQDIYLLHTRLSILDLSNNGNQPFVRNTPKGKIVSIHNGEIYNFKNLINKYDLNKNGVLLSDSDSEVIPHIYSELGCVFASELSGMYACAIYDEDTHQIILTRDTLGIKPLYYVNNHKGFHFSSEIKSLIPFINQEKIRLQAVSDFLSLGYIVEPQTFFEEIVCVPMGCTLIFDCEKKIVEIIQNAVLNGDFVNKVANVNELIESAIHGQLISDVPMGSFLSGGVDSTLVSTVFANNVTNSKTFTVSFKDTSRDESMIAKSTSDYLGTDHTQICLENNLSIEDVKLLIGHMDQPFGDLSIIPLYNICKETKTQVKVVLSGDGGDEFCGGYPKFWQFKLAVRIQKYIPKILIKLGIHVLDLFQQSAVIKKIVKLLRLSLDSDSEKLFNLSTYIADSDKQRLLRKDVFSATHPTHNYFNFDTRGLSDGQIVTTSQVLTSLVSKMLRKVDMMSMLAGIEVRVPLLDEELCSYLYSIRDSEKFSLFENKIVFRNYLKKNLTFYNNKNKVGFDLGEKEPDYIRLIEEMKDVIFLGKDNRIWSLINYDETHKLLITHPKKYSKSSYFQLIVHFFVLHFWFERIFEKNDICRAHS
jgi:asparagine synthase (glutamine-hydrolysing)